MRPDRLQVAGFTAFRQPTEVDFTGADLFALSGPTGAGKSSLIDAITFALYGSVARYEDDRLVAPIVSQGLAEARVALDFTVEGRGYTAVRVVRTTRTGKATTKEARLERHLDEGTTEVLAGDAAGVTAAVEQLLGMGFRQLTTCVVLPQGQFARFLHAKPADRQELLVRLLELGLYKQMAATAHERAVGEQAKVAQADQALARLAFASADGRAAAAGRIEQLEALQAHIEELQPTMEDISVAVREAEREAVEVEQRSADLRGLGMPEGVEQVANRAAMAREEAAQSGRDLAAAELVLEKAEAALADGPPAAELRATVDRHDERAGLAAKAEVLTGLEAEARDLERALAREVQAAEQALGEARLELEQARVADRAADLRAHLHEGEPCPVCEQVVAVVPDAGRADLEVAEKAVAAADSSRAAAVQSHREAEKALSKADAQRTQVAERLDAATEALAPLGSRAEVEERLGARLEAEQAVERARTNRRDAAKATSRADERRAGIEQQERSLREQWVHQQARVLKVGTTAPPEATDDLHADWQRLVDWLDFERPILERQAEAARRTADQHRSRRDRLLAEVDQAMAGVGLEPGSRPRRDVCVDALAAARAELARLDEALADVEHQRAERDRAHDKAQVADAVHRLLGARGFERWVLDEVVDRLVDGATDALLALSSGAYSLTRTERGEFAVIDHTNADAVRLARTLSGGETFLASLALALALADRVAELSASGSQRLDAIFLDEGFGTLDPDALDVVASAIEELGAQGRMVGIVTHVRELAERLPVRFEVTKQPEGASVVRVDG